MAKTQNFYLYSHVTAGIGIIKEELSGSPYAFLYVNGRLVNECYM